MGPEQSIARTSAAESLMGAMTDLEDVIGRVHARLSLGPKDEPRDQAVEPMPNDVLVLLKNRIHEATARLAEIDGRLSIIQG